MKQSENILPFEENVMIKTYNYISFYLGILQAYNKNVNQLLVNEFLHIFFFRNKIDFIASGHYHKKRFHYKNTKKYVSRSIHAIKEEIDKKRYVVIILNEKFISNKDIKTEVDYYHDWLIYGYDDKKSVFYCAGYSGNDLISRLYKLSEISYTDILNSNAHIAHNCFSGTKKDTHSSWINEEYEEKTVTSEKIIQQLYRFIHPPKILMQYIPATNPDIVAIHKFYCFILKLCQKKKPLLLFTQSFRIIYEHAKVLKLALTYVTNNEQILKECDVLINQANLLLFKAAKFNAKTNHQDKKPLVSIGELLLEIENKEKSIIQNAININNGIKWTSQVNRFVDQA